MFRERSCVRVKDPGRGPGLDGMADLHIDRGAFAAVPARLACAGCAALALAQ